ncbi:MAG: hypothetical protein J5849_02620 [Clostridia bacterium]|nr:hypothetical protein [Clostridia bacterium]
MPQSFSIPPHLPRRLTVSFPLWALFDTGGGPFHDLDRLVREHRERGFNCLRVEGGAGLTHDLTGRRRGPVFLHAPFGRFTSARLRWYYGGDGPCDVLSRLVELAEACRKYDVYLILSSWYFLHTFWYLDNALNAELLSVPSEDTFAAFARFLHYVLLELEARGLSDRIAMAEIFNEVPSIPVLLGGLKGEDVGGIDFPAKHAEALSWLRERHPEILFAVDSDNLTDVEIARIPPTLQAFNGHNYFLWGVYGGTLEEGEPERNDLFPGRFTRRDVAEARAGLLPFQPANLGWYDRVAKCHNLDPARIPALEEHLTERLSSRRAEYLSRLDDFCEGFRKVMARFPGIPVVCGEGVDYVSSQELLWEEKSEEYWELVGIAMAKYKELGLWGTLIKTNSGPGDPSWTLCKDRMRALNEAFLAD